MQISNLRPAVLGALLFAAGAAVSPSIAGAQNASLIVYMRAAGGGAFNQTSSTATQVRTFAVSGVAARYNSGTNLYAPTVGKVTAGGSFSQSVPSLYSPALVPGNTYQVELTYTDNADKKLTFGPLTLSAGTNNLGSGGLGTTTPIDITNDPPPAAKNLNCYADLPDRSTQLYLSWSGPLLATVKDYGRTEVHMAKTAGFTPSAATLIATPPYGTDYRKVTGLTPVTDYYFCVRVYDRYGAFTDACRAAACTTAAPPATPDGGATSDGGATDDAGATGDAGSVSDAGATDDAGAVSDGSAGDPDAGSGDADGGAPSDDGGDATDASVTPNQDPSNPAGGEPSNGSVAIGCGCSLASAAPTPGLLILVPAAIALWRARRRRAAR
ncbi:MAG TPA: MYXO-CTERM sorting domain-containing protein [Pseudomonadota bacterium]|nr:MYXO-CTERM sorting domain-containing protein [Pseudomonadota bacterium]